MSLHGSFLSDDQFACSICLDVFNNPSSTPCGHSFCMGCISRYWDGTKVCQCPLCKKTFQKRPDLQINRTLREITEQFRSMRGGGGPVREKRGVKAVGGGGGDGGLPDGLFDELKKKLPRPLPKVPVMPTCEPILTSFSAAQTPLASSVPSYSPIAAMNQNGAPPPPPPAYSHSRGRRRFTMSGASSDQNLPVCETHHRGTLIYCRTDQVCICPECETLDHYDHDTVSVEDEWVKTKAQLSVSEQEIQEMIRQRIRKIEEIRMSVSELELAVERETAGSVCLFSTLVSAIERSQAELMEVMEISRRAAEHQADAMIRQLELEVVELRRRESALAELAQSDDHIHCLKTFPSLCSPPPAKDWSAVSVDSDLGTGTIYRSLVAQMEKFQAELKKITETGFPALIQEPSPVRAQPRMKRVQDYAVDVTLNSMTAHPRLVMSEDMKSVRCGDRHQLLPDNPERFDRVVCILGREAISSGRHYWEVEVGKKTDWDLGVARHSINRKGKIEVTPSNGYWFLSLRDKNKYAFRTEPSTDVQISLRPSKIGIFVDFENGQVSFYNVDAKIHIYTFNDVFNECVYPFFSPCTNKSGKNDGPLTITPVSRTE
ncbi:E3 ubiquitin-protein ligase TRIM39 [Acanthopagrus latus]|uniref:E3 ubiquitin-protein ligase TRIM39 n=1 Tax=Acanthopagrus latus TaxID=8177 RepID=UPI00187C8D65|nr:E3 ubiquitin-protein ligase TRIM39 [Acanthopagrus latus]